MVFEWTQDFDVKIDEYNDQHVNLFKMINSLEVNVASNAGHDAQQKTLDELVPYCVNHFKCEEREFQAKSYPQTDSHTKIHNDFLEKVGAVYKAHSNKEAEVDTGLVDFLKDWLVKHIKGSDQQYSDFLNQVGVH